jgi:hypothetical protein
VKIRLAGFKGVTVPATVPVPRGKASATVTITTATTTAARRGSITATLGSVRKYPPVPATVTVGRYYDYATVVMVPKKNLSGQYASTVTANTAVSPWPARSLLTQGCPCCRYWAAPENLTRSS